MLFQRISRTSPEKIFGIFKNTDTVALTDGMPVSHDTTAADGNSAKKTAATANLLNVIGFASGNDIAVGSWGTIQVYGYHPGIVCDSTLSAANLCIATIATAGTCGTAADPATGAGLANLGVTLAAQSGSKCKAFIRCL